MANKKVPARVTNLLLTPDKLKKALHEAGSMQKLSEKLGVCRNTVKSYCDKFGIKTLGKGRPLELTVDDRKKKYDERKKRQVEVMKEQGKILILPKLSKEAKTKLKELKQPKETFEDVLIKARNNFLNNANKKPVNFGIVTVNFIVKPIVVQKEFREVLNLEASKLNLTIGEYITLLLFNY